MRRFICLLLVLVSPTLVRGDEPLHKRIDALLRRDAVGPIGVQCSDADFIRRVCLDLTGRIPSDDRARAFLQDSDPSKREKLVNELIDSDGFSRRLALLLDVMFMERRADKHIKSDEWRNYLLASVRANKPYNVLCREILAADGSDDSTRGAAKFFLDRESEANLMTRDVGRVFFGMDFQCAQCHNHPLVNDYYQRDYYGIYEFVSRSYVFDDKKAKKKFLAERPEGDIDFKSVFTEQSGYTQPKLPTASPITEPVVKLGEEYKVAPAKDIRPIPSYSRRARLAELATDGSNVAFNRNIANRLWGLIIGRGIVEPVDFHHTDNPPTHPELLELLSNEIVAMKFDVKAFLREIVLTEAYEREIALPGNFAASRDEAIKLRESLTAQIQAQETAVQDADVAYAEALEAVAESSVALLPLRGERDKVRKSWAKAKKKQDAALKPLTEATKKRDAAKRIVEALKPALEATLAASKRLADDAEVVSVAAALKAKVEPQATALAAAETEVAKHQAASKAGSDAMVAALKQQEEVYAKIKAANEATAQKEQVQLDAQRKRRDLLLRQKQMQLRLEWCNAYLTQLDCESKAEELDAGLAQATAETAKLTQQVESNQTDLNRQAELMAAQAAKIKAGQERLAELKKQAEAANNSPDALAAIETQEKELRAAAEAMATAETAFEKAKADLAQAVETQKQLQVERQALESKREAAKQTLDAASAEITKAWTQQFAVAELKPLTAEQFAWSLMQIGGLVERQIAASTAALDKSEPLTEEIKSDPAKLAERQQKIENEAFAKLQGNVKSFISLYAGGAGQPQNEFFATVDQALFVSNNTMILGWIRPSGTNLTARLGKMEDAAQLAEALYIGVLTRSPTEDEKKEVAAYLESRSADRAAAIEEMVWALACSVEFRFNH